MTHKPFDDEQLEHVLNNAPKLSDHRSKEDILNRLMADARLQDNSYLQEAIQQPKRMNKSKAIPPSKKNEQHDLSFVKCQFL